MKTVGVLTIVFLGLGAVAYFGGFMEGSADVKLTDKGRQTINKGLSSAKEGINNGLEHLKVDEVPQAK